MLLAGRMSPVASPSTVSMLPALINMKTAAITAVMTTRVLQTPYTNKFRVVVDLQEHFASPGHL